MIKNGLSAPLHEGAARYKEKGWISSPARENCA